jgi:hypothetical protein
VAARVPIRIPVHPEESFDLRRQTRLLEHLALHRVLQSFAELHEAARERVPSAERLVSAANEDEFSFVKQDRVHRQPRDVPAHELTPGSAS